jgi:transposase
LFAQQILPILDSTRRAHQDYHADKLTLEQLQNHRLIVEAQLAQVLNTPPEKGWAADAQALANCFTCYWSDWFTFLTHPQVKPDNNDAVREATLLEQRALGPVVIHRKGGARSQWGREYWLMPGVLDQFYNPLHQSRAWEILILNKSSLLL